MAIAAFYLSNYAKSATAAVFLCLLVACSTVEELRPTPEADALAAELGFISKTYQYAPEDTEIYTLLEDPEYFDLSDAECKGGEVHLAGSPWTFDNKKVQCE